MPKEHLESSNLRQITVYLPEDVIEKIDEIVKERRSKRSTVIREILVKHFKK